MLWRSERWYVLVTKSSSWRNLSRHPHDAKAEQAHLVIVLKLDTLINVPTGFEQAETVGSQNGQHAIIVGKVALVAGEMGVLDLLRVGHHNRLKIDTGEEGLRQRISQVPGHLCPSQRPPQDCRWRRGRTS